VSGMGNPFGAGRHQLAEDRPSICVSTKAWWAGEVAGDPLRMPTF
jgi:hypothetical protein